MYNVIPDFKILEGSEIFPAGHQNIKLHMDFYLHMDFRWKARLVAGGNMTETHAILTYSSVLSFSSVRIALLLATLNELDVL